MRDAIHGAQFEVVEDAPYPIQAVKPEQYIELTIEFLRKRGLGG